MPTQEVHPLDLLDKVLLKAFLLSLTALVVVKARDRLGATACRGTKDDDAALENFGVDEEEISDAAIPQQQRWAQVLIILTVAMAHVVCLRLDCAWCVLPRLLSAFGLPLMLAKLQTFATWAPLRVYLIAHFLLSCAIFFRSLHEGIQWVPAVGICNRLCWAINVEQEEKLSSTSRSIQQLLSTTCSGFVVISASGSLVDADAGAMKLFGMERERGALRARKFDGLFRAEGVMPGLRTMWLEPPRGAGDDPSSARLKCQVKVTAVTSPCPVPASHLSVLFQTEPQAKPAASHGLLYLCTFSVSEDARKDAPADHSASRASSSGRRWSEPWNCMMVEAAKATPPLRVIDRIGLGTGRYAKVRLVGSGSHGQVFEVKGQAGHRFAQKQVSLERLRLHGDFPMRVRAADLQIQVLKELARASNVIVPVVEAWIQSDLEMAVVVMEWLPESLEKEISRQRNANDGPVPLADVCRWLASMAMGIAIIHVAGLIHRDIKPSNILFDQHFSQCKIADLGLSRALQRSKSHKVQQLSVEQGCFLDLPDNMLDDLGVGTPVSTISDTDKSGSTRLSSSLAKYGQQSYCAPEALNTKTYDSPMDMFSLGCILVEMMTLESPHELQLGARAAICPPSQRARDLLQKPPRPAADEAAACLPSTCAQGLAREPDGTGSGRECSIRCELESICVSMLSISPQSRPSARDIITMELLQHRVEALGRECETVQKFVPLLPGARRANLPAPVRHYPGSRRGVSWRRSKMLAAVHEPAGSRSQPAPPDGGLAGQSSAVEAA